MLIISGPAELNAERTQLAVAIAVPILVALCLVLIGVAAFMIYKRRKQKKESAKTPPR